MLMVCRPLPPWSSHWRRPMTSPLSSSLWVALYVRAQAGSVLVWSWPLWMKIFLRKLHPSPLQCTMTCHWTGLLFKSTVSKKHQWWGCSTSALNQFFPKSPNLTPFSISFPSSDTHAVLQPLVELEAGDYMVTVMVSDSGSPVMSSYAQVNITVCLCDSFGDCKSVTGAILGSSVGISFIFLIIIMASVALLLCKSQLEYIIHSSKSFPTRIKQAGHKWWLRGTTLYESLHYILEKFYLFCLKIVLGAKKTKDKKVRHDIILLFSV